MAWGACVLREVGSSFLTFTPVAGVWATALRIAVLLLGYVQA